MRIHDRIGQSSDFGSAKSFWELIVKLYLRVEHDFDYVSCLRRVQVSPTALYERGLEIHQLRPPST